MPRTLIVDGEWNLKRNFAKRVDLYSNSGEHCGGVFGFIETLGNTINKTLPDRVIVVWDGDMSGKLRHDIYPLYKHDHKEWDEEYYFRTAEELDDQSRLKISCTNQKIQTKNLLEGLFIRQAEVEYIEGDDLIALYVLNKEPDEQVIIFSRDKDYYQLINENVYVLRPADNIVVTPQNFRKLFSFVRENCLILKCFEGDPSDNVSGIPGIALKTILKYFPKFADEEYTIDRFISEAVALYQEKKLKTIETFIGSRKIYERNKKLMDLHNPMVNEEAIEEMKVIKDCVLAKENGQVDRSVNGVMREVIKEGYVKHMYNNDVAKFFMPYQRIAAKEKEYVRKVLQG